MNLIDEIKAASTELITQESYPRVMGARDIVRAYTWWPRVRAALEAAQEVDMLLHGNGDQLYTARLKFREAMGE